MTARPKALVLLTQSNDSGGRLTRELARLCPGLDVGGVEHHSHIGPEISGVEVLFTFGVLLTDAILRDAASLKWIHVLGSGTDGVIDRPTLRPEVIVTNSRGLQAEPVSETALALMFALARDIPALVRQQDRQEWRRAVPMLLTGKTLVIVGVGAIAERLASKAQALGMTIIGVSAGRAQAPGFARIHPRTEIADAAAQADFVVNLAPATAETSGLIGANVLGAMKRTAYFINVGRGGVVDEAALIRALEAGSIAGAGLDVMQIEPLPHGHRLWTLSNVLISPHLGGLHAGFIDTLIPLVLHNCTAYLAGDIPAMRNLVRPTETPS